MTGLLGLLAAATLAGCSSSGPTSTTTPSARPTPIEQLRTGSMTLPRIEFCTLVRPAAVARALDGKATDDEGWGNGDRQALAGGTGGAASAVQETGCAWSRETTAGTTTGTTTARAWVFARPVDRRTARTVVADARATKGCRTPAGPAYGEPAVLQVCSAPAAGLAAGQRRVRHAGLFGDTWLTCELQGPAGADLRDRADAWCVEVADALDTSR